VASPAEGDRAPIGAIIGTLIFVAVVPGTVIGLVPYLVTGWRVEPALLGLPVLRWAGAALIVVAAPVFVDFLARFALEGRGTPAPIAPPEHLVVRGVFKYVRNPGYVAVLSLVVGQALLFGSAWLLAYAAALGLGFHLFVVFYEEPTLRAQFGEEYEAYCRRVPRWMPRVGRSGTRLS
jgi:protein-S-isoprenylcysteine O-methyltransferase Ste14